jgi:hypothetical protein
MLFIRAVGGGGGGGGGFTGGAGTARGGGGGGSSGNCTNVIMPCMLIPETLHVKPGGGEIGRTSGGAASGTHSAVSITPFGHTVAANIVAFASPGNGGATGTATAGGAGGTAPGADTIANCPWAGLGVAMFLQGTAGTIGGDDTGAVGGAIAFPSTGNNVMGGSGGGGVTTTEFAGGLITAIAGTLISDSRPQVGAAAAAGSGGHWLFDKGGFAYGGLGGGSVNSATGANGGNGGPGCGGGGGGAGNGAGRGGDGGPGYIIMVSW